MKHLFSLLTFTILISCVQKTSKESISIGTVKNGKLINGKKFSYNHENYSFFSFFSYYVLNRAYVNGKVKKTNEECFAALKEKFPYQKWRIMECSRKHGGSMKPHRTHQNGTSIDFMTPLINVKTNKQYRRKDWIGVWHYLLEFDEKGYLKGKKNIRIDFNMLAEHILELNKHCKRNGIKIKKVLLKINLKDDLFKTPKGKELKKTGIYFAKYLTPMVDKLHDDHYHIDFQL